MVAPLAASAPERIRIARRRFGAAGLALCLLAGLAFGEDKASAAGRGELVRLKTRGEVEQAYLLKRGSGPVKAVAILFTGGYGLLRFRETGGEVSWSQEGTSFLVLNMDRFLDGESAIAVPDVPTDQLNFGYTPRFRKSDAHVADIRAIVSDVKNRFPNAKLFLIGTSQGSTSAAYAGKALGRHIHGVVLTASVFEWAPASWNFLHDSNLKDFDFSAIEVPLLLVHHADDRCAATPFASAVEIAEKYPLITVRGGEPVRDNGCGPRGPHGFLGREAETVAEILNWMHGRQFRREID